MKSKEFTERVRLSYQQCFAEGNTSLEQMAKCLNKKKCTTDRGQAWTPLAVQDLEKEFQMAKRRYKVKSVPLKKDNVIEASDKFTKKEEIWIPN